MPHPELPSPAPVWSIPLSHAATGGLRLHVSGAIALAIGGAVVLASGSTTAALVMAATLVSVALHETAHRLAGRRAWRRGEPLVLGPLGAMSLPLTGLDAQQRVFVAMAGPLANLAVVVASLSLLAAPLESTDRWGSVALLVAPLLAEGEALLVGATPADTLARALVGVNWLLFLASLVPARSFDGATALRGLLEPRLGRHAARDATALAGLSIAAGMAGIGVAAGAVVGLAPWVGPGLVGLAVVAAFGAAADLADRRLLDGPPAPPRSRRAAAEESGLVLVEVRRDHVLDEAWDDDAPRRSDESQLDDVLAKVHRDGVERLTADERALLERASQRYRDQRGGRETR